MQFNEVRFDNATPVDGYGPGFFRIGGAVLRGPVLLTLEGVNSWGGYDDRNRLLALAEAVDVILFGTGPEIAHLPKGLRAEIETAGMGAEVMNTPAACRTWNVLASEGRRVAMAAMPV